MNYYGDRYLTASQFKSHCSSLNIKTDFRELEYYEQEGLMYPVARIVYPEEYVLLQHELTHGQIPHEHFLESQSWPECDRLTDKNFGFLSAFEDVTDDDLVHHIDREIDSNSLLSRPIEHEYQPWDSYDIQISIGNDNTIKASRAEHYYSYWQAHQLYRLQRFTDCYRDRWLMDILSDDQKRRLGYDIPTDPRPFATYLSLDSRFDALSFWTTVYDRERARTFAGVPEHHRVKTLSRNAADEYGERLESAATKTLQRFRLTTVDLYRFLHKLLQLFEDYKRDERLKLHVDIRRDIFSLSGLIECATVQNFDEVGVELSKYSNYVQTFRHLHIPTRERDEAATFCKHILEDSDKGLETIAGVQWSSMAQEAEDMLDYCLSNGLDVLVTALSGMTAVGDDEYRQKFRRVQRYSNLKNILTSYEYFLKSIAQNAGLAIGGQTLIPALECVMRHEPWLVEFQVPSRKALLRANSINDFLNNLESLNRDSHLQTSANGMWAYMFLVTCLARNLTVHAYPNEHRYYGELFGTMLDSVVMALAYTWDLAKTRGWL